MRKAKVPLTNFQFGEISPSLISRTDTRVYNNSAQKIENFLLRAEGAVIKIMRRSLKPSSFRLWRKRAKGQSIKHRKKFEETIKEIRRKIKKNDYI